MPFIVSDTVCKKDRCTPQQSQLITRLNPTNSHSLTPNPYSLTPNPYSLIPNPYSLTPIP
ncbi:MAG TPA: hypothetical protein ENI88_07725 [Desulfobulbus sp.]|nr:hypothetical protein [Desulfobulbus sp.]